MYIAIQYLYLGMVSDNELKLVQSKYLNYLLDLSNFLSWY